MHVDHQEDPAAVTRVVLEAFAHISEEEIADHKQRLRSRFPESSEVDLLDALLVSRAVPDLGTVAEVSERWLDAWSSLDEVWQSPNRASVIAFLGKLYRDKLATYLGMIVADARGQLKQTNDAKQVVILLDGAHQAINETTEDFGDLAGIDRFQDEYWNELKKRRETALSQVREKEKEASRDARRLARENSKGKCDACGKDPRVLTTLESEQRVCRTCLKQLRPPRSKHLASPKQITDLRESGMTVSEGLTPDEARLLKKLAAARQCGLTIRDGATEAEIDSAIASGPSSFLTKVVGVTSQNEDGSSRQKPLRKCRIGEALVLIREPDNPHDRNAIKVCKRGWFLFSHRQIGYLSAFRAEALAPLMDRGTVVSATVAQIHGRDSWSGARESFGLTIRISYAS